MDAGGQVRRLEAHLNEVLGEVAARAANRELMAAQLNPDPARREE
ncbi:hypothetical protein AB0I10_39575 [Streptomyces sp. NPDC050636]